MMAAKANLKESGMAVCGDTEKKTPPARRAQGVFRCLCLEGYLMPITSLFYEISCG